MPPTGSGTAATLRADATLPTAPLAQWTYPDALAAVNAAALARISHADYHANERYLAGDHWQQGATWLGPRGDDSTWPTIAAAVRRQFVAVGVIGEVLGRVASGLLKREAALTFAPLAPAGDDDAASARQEAEAAAMAAHVSAWWDRVTLWEHARTVVMRARALTRGVLRLTVAEGQLVRGPDGRATLPTDLPLADAFRRVALTAPDTGTCALVEEARTQRPVGVVHHAVIEAGRTRRWAELWTVGPIAAAVADGGAPGEPSSAATSDAAAVVHVRVLPETGPAVDYRLPFDRLPIAEAHGALLITEGVRRQQARLDFGESMLVRGMETSGFRERYVINAEPQGTWVDEDPGTAIDVRTFADGVTRWLLPEVRTLGSAITTELRGIESGAEGQRATPSVVIAEPSDPALTIRATEHARATILHETHQAHVLANGDAAASGYSRQQARADHENDLAATKPALEGALRATIEAAVAYALTMASDADLQAQGIGRDFLSRFRAVVTCHLDAGPLSPDERRAVVEEHKAGLRDRRAALAALGEEDVEAAIGRLDAEGAQKLAQLRSIGEVLDVLAKAGSYDGAVRLLEASGVLTPEQARALAPHDTDGVDGDGDEDDETDGGE